MRVITNPYIPTPPSVRATVPSMSLSRITICLQTHVCSFFILSLSLLSLSFALLSHQTSLSAGQAFTWWVNNRLINGARWNCQICVQESKSKEMKKRRNIKEKARIIMNLYPRFRCSYSSPNFSASRRSHYRKGSFRYLLPQLHFCNILLQ